MDFSQLDDALDEGGYVPTFGGKTPKINNPKPLLKSNSNKSFQSGLSIPTPPPQRSNLLQLHKETRKQVTTFQDFFKQQSANESAPTVFNNSVAPPSRPYIEPPKAQTSSVKREAKPTATKDQLDINSILDEDDSPQIARRGMKPPLSRRNDDGRSVASRKNDQTRSLAPVGDTKKSSKQGQKQNANVWEPPPQNKPSSSQYLGNQNPSKEGEPRQFERQFKKLLEDQLKMQRQLSDKISKEEASLHKQELERLKSLHQQELKRKMELKDLQISSLKENYQFKINSIYKSINEAKVLDAASIKLEEGAKALQRAGQQFKIKSGQLAEESSAKTTLLRELQQFSSQKEKSVNQMLERLSVREREFKEDKTRILAQLQRDRRRLQESQLKLSKKEKELQEKYLKKERKLIQQFEEKHKKLTDSQQTLRLAKTEFEQEKIRFYQQKEENLKRNRQWQESRSKLMEELQLDKTRVMAQEIELTGKLQEWEIKSNEMLIKEKDLSGKLKLIEMERKKWSAQRDMKRQPVDSLIKTSGITHRSYQQPAPSGLQKSLKQLKDEYLKNLGYM